MKFELPEQLNLPRLARAKALIGEEKLFMSARLLAGMMRFAELEERRNFQVTDQNYPQMLKCVEFFMDNPTDWSDVVLEQLAKAVEEYETPKYPLMPEPEVTK